MYDKALPYIYRHIWWSPVLPGWSYQGKRVKSKLCCSNNPWGQKHRTFMSLFLCLCSGTAMEEQQPEQQWKKKSKGITFFAIFPQTDPNQSRQENWPPPCAPTGKEKQQSAYTYSVNSLTSLIKDNGNRNGPRCLHGIGKMNRSTDHALYCSSGELQHLQNFSAGKIKDKWFLVKAE